MKIAVAVPQYQQSDTGVVTKIFIERLKNVSKYLGEKKYLVGDYVSNFNLRLRMLISIYLNCWKMGTLFRREKYLKLTRIWSPITKELHN